MINCDFPITNKVNQLVVANRQPNIVDIILAKLIEAGVESDFISAANRKIIHHDINKLNEYIKENKDCKGLYTVLSELNDVKYTSNTYSVFQNADGSYRYNIIFTDIKTALYVESNNGVQYKVVRNGKVIFDNCPDGLLQYIFKKKDTTNEVIDSDTNFLRVRSKAMKEKSLIHLSQTGLLLFTPTNIKHLQVLVDQLQTCNRIRFRDITEIECCKRSSWVLAIHWLKEVELLRKTGDLYYFNFKAINEILSLLKSINYYGIDGRPNVNKGIELLEALVIRKEKILRSDLTYSHTTAITKAEENNTPVVEYVKASGLTGHQRYVVPTPEAHRIIDVYQQIYRLLSSFNVK